MDWMERCTILNTILGARGGLPWRALSQNAPHQFDAARGVPVVRPGRGDAGREALSAGGVLGTHASARQHRTGKGMRWARIHMNNEL